MEGGELPSPNKRVKKENPENLANIVIKFSD